MTTQRLGIIMNGVTGRMGTNQHLIRSIVAIRDAAASGFERRPRDARSDPGRPQRRQARAAGQAVQRRALDHRSRRGARRPERHGVLRCGDDAGAAGAADARRSPPASTSIARSRSRPISTRRSRSRGSPTPSGVKHGVVQDKLFLPGLQKLAFLSDSGFFGRILSVRGEFGYWVFEGDWQPAQRPSWNYRKRGRRRHHPRHALPLALRARQSVRRGRKRDLPRRHAHPRALRRAGQQLPGDRRRCRLCHLRARRAA